MPSQLVYKALKINQHITDTQLSFFPIRWCSNENKWKYGNAKSWHLFLFVTILWKVVILTPLVFIALNQMIFKYHELFKIQHIFVALMTLNLIIGSVILDSVSYIYGTDMVVCCNWCYETENTWMHVLMTKKSGKATRKPKTSEPKGNITVKYI